MHTIKDCFCFYCGHPVMAEGVDIDPDDDTDRTGAERDRCADTACVSRAVCTYQGDVLVVAGLQSDRHHADPEPGDPCPRCDTPLLSCSPSGRGTAACDNCQTVYGEEDA